MRSLRPVLAALTASTLLFAAGAAVAQNTPPAVRDQRANRVVIDRVIAVVNDAIVLESELAVRVLPLLADLDSVTDPREKARRQQKIAEQMLADMVNEELIVQSAVEARLDVDAKEIKAAVDEIKQQNNLDDKGLAQALAMQGYTLESYKRDVRRQILRMRAVNTLVRPRVTVTDEDIRARYDAMNRRTGAVSKVRLSHLLIEVADKANDTELAAAKARAADAINRARAGEDFTALAKELSDDTGTKDGGGDLGWIERGSIPTEWEAIVFSMGKGEVRGPVSGPSGLHVFYVAEVKQNDLKPFDEMKEEIRNDLYRREMDKQTAVWLEELKKKAFIELKL